MTDLIVARELDGLREYHPTGLILDPTTTFEEWAAMGRPLLMMEWGARWWVGDWLRFGERRYGERYTQAIQETGIRYKTLANLAWVAGRFEFSRRRENLSWSHHEAVAGLDDPEEQDRLLDQAAEHGWSVIELREQARRAKKAIKAGKDAASLPAAKARDETRDEDEDDVLDDGGPTTADLLAELEAADQKIREQQMVIESIRSDDPAARIIEWATRYQQLQGHLQRQNAKLAEAQRLLKRKSDLLARIRRALGVDDDAAILDAIAALKG